MTVRKEWDWPPERRRLPTEYVTNVQPNRRAKHPARTNELRPPKHDWASSPITTKIADAYFGFIWFVLKMAFAAFLGVVPYGSGWLFFQSVSLMH
jgi:hypothetical protein